MKTRSRFAIVVAWAAALLVTVTVLVAGSVDKKLDIYLIDTEGGAATLIVTPKGESLLVDSGNPGERDPARIVRVVTEVASLNKIDHHIITHWHGDHFGGTEAVAKQVPIGQFYDHGTTVEDPGKFEDKFAWYLKLSESKRRVLKPGDEIKLGADSDGPPLRLVCVCAAGLVLPNQDGRQPKGDGCDKHPPQPEDKSDNAASLGFKLSFGEFDFLDCGDLTWNIEHRLVCPENKIGIVDVYQTNHHGLANSNNPALIHAIRPRVAVMNNGPRKGGEPSVIAALRESPGFEAIFQVHRNVRRGDEDNAPAEFVANAAEQCDGDYVWLTVEPDGKSYTVAAGAKGKPHRFQTK
jgi:beta-lactamase superfamily II metal-dependent hydrolase